MQNQAVEVLYRVRDKIDKHWIKKTLAINKYGHGVPPTDSEACAWCAVGALDCEARDVPQAVREKLEQLLAKQAELMIGQLPNWLKENRRTIEFYNDTYLTTKEDMLAMIDKAIAQATQTTETVTNVER